MQIIDEDGNQIIKCECGFAIYRKGVIRTRVILVENGRMLIKCPQCKRMTESVSVKMFLKEEVNVEKAY